MTEDIDSRKLADQMAGKASRLSEQLRSGRKKRRRRHPRGSSDDVKTHEWPTTKRKRKWSNSLAKGLKHFEEEWDELKQEDDDNEKSKQLKTVIGVLELEVRYQAVQLFNYNSLSIEKSEQGLHDTIPWIAWGLFLVGSIGSLGGILLGYGVARALRQSIYQLSVRIRDAAGRLGQDLPTVIVDHHLFGLRAEVVEIGRREIEEGPADAVAVSPGGTSGACRRAKRCAIPDARRRRARPRSAVR